LATSAKSEFDFMVLGLNDKVQHGQSAAIALCQLRDPADNCWLQQEHRSVEVGLVEEHSGTCARAYRGAVPLELRKRGRASDDSAALLAGAGDLAASGVAGWRTAAPGSRGMGKG